MFLPLILKPLNENGKTPKIVISITLMKVCQRRIMDTETIGKGVVPSFDFETSKTPKIVIPIILTKVCQRSKMVGR